MRKGQISLSLILAVIGPILAGTVGLGYFSLERANDAIDRTAVVEAQVAAINVKLDFLVNHAGGIVDPVNGVVKIVTSTKK